MLRGNLHINVGNYSQIELLQMFNLFSASFVHHLFFQDLNDVISLAVPEESCYLAHPDQCNLIISTSIIEKSKVDRGLSASLKTAWLKPAACPICL